MLHLILSSYVYVLISGVCRSLIQPLRQALVANTVPKEALGNALATNVLTITGTRLIGPFFGGILIANVTIDADTAAEIVKIFSEVVIAPGFTDDALKVLSDKQNLRVIKFNTINNEKSDNKMLKSVYGGYLVQDRDQFIIDKSDMLSVSIGKC